MVQGYKAFNKDMTNRYGVPFAVGMTYQTTGEVKFGNDGNGFHMCKNLCDVFRYFSPENLVVAAVTGFGSIVTYEDDYNGYYDMYAVEKITIDRILTREDIMTIMLQDHEINNQKFLATYTLTPEEQIAYLKKYQNRPHMLAYVLYYQLKLKDAYSMSVEEQQKELRKVLQYGQNNN